MTLTVDIVNLNQEENKMYNTNEFVDKLNEQMPGKWNLRLVRHYTTLGALSKPDKDGRNAVYNDEHIRQAKTIFDLQKTGMAINKLYKNPNVLEDVLSSYSEENSLNYSQAIGEEPKSATTFSTSVNESAALNFADTNLGMSKNMASSSAPFGAMRSLVSSKSSSGKIVSPSVSVLTSSVPSQSVSAMNLQNSSHTRTISSSPENQEIEKMKSMAMQVLQMGRTTKADLKEELVYKFELDRGLVLYSSVQQKEEAKKLITLYKENNHENQSKKA